MWAVAIVYAVSNLVIPTLMEVQKQKEHCNFLLLVLTCDCDPTIFTTICTWWKQSGLAKQSLPIVQKRGLLLTTLIRLLVLEFLQSETLESYMPI